MFQMQKQKVSAMKIYISSLPIWFNDEFNFIILLFLQKRYIMNQLQNKKQVKSSRYAIWPLTILQWTFSLLTADSLIEIQANQILPFVQLLNHTNMELQHPESLEKVFTDRGRIINGTRFTSKNKAEQLLFCPKENSVEYCLVPKKFQGLEPLQCSKEPTPYVREEQNQILCGPHDSGKTYNVVYEVSLNTTVNVILV